MADHRRSGRPDRRREETRDPLRRVAALAAEINTLATRLEEPVTAAQARRMNLRQLLQDPVRAAIYYRGWDDRADQVRRSMVAATPRPTPNGPAPRATVVSQRHQPPPPPAPSTSQQAATTTAPAPPSAAAIRAAEAKRARSRKSLQKLKEKIRARATTSQQFRLTRRPELEINPGPSMETTADHPTPDIMEVDAPTTGDNTPQVSGQTTAHNAAEPEVDAEEAWLQAPPNLSDLLDDTLDDPYETPAASPGHPTG